MLGRAFKRLWNDKRGNALLIMAGAFPLLLGSAGLATDTIQWTLTKRQLQRAADSAAIAGVYASVQKEQNAGAQSVTDAIAAHLYVNKAVSLQLKNANVVLNVAEEVDENPSSPYLNAVRVKLSSQKSLAFSSMFMGTAKPITAEATAATIETGVYCVVSLENTDSTGITATGNGDINLGCGMITNSISLDAAIATGSVNIDADPVAAVGGIGGDQWGAGTTLLPFTLAQADPFADIYPPVPSGSCPGVTVGANVTTHISNTTGTACFGGMSLNGTVTMDPGVYLIDAGNFSVGSGANVTCNECVFILTSRTADTNPASVGSVTMNGGPQLNLTAPTSGPFEDILFYQDRRARSLQGANPIANRINGSATSILSGAFYFPRQALDLNGTAELTITCGQFVARTVTFSGNGGIDNSCDDYGGSSIKGLHVRLVA